MTPDREAELRIKVLSLMMTPKLTHVSECARWMLFKLGSLTSGGTVVYQLSDQFIETIELLWDELCRDNVDTQVAVFPLITQVAADAERVRNNLESPTRPCQGCGATPVGVIDSTTPELIRPYVPGQQADPPVD